MVTLPIQRHLVAEALKYDANLLLGGELTLGNGSAW